MAEERTSAQTAVFRNTDGRNQISNIVETSLAGTKKKGEKEKSKRIPRDFAYKTYGLQQKKVFSRKTQFFHSCLFYLSHLHFGGRGS